ncbi:hypothetical protein SASPL_112760 [Salvia splendens]|uniref:Protein kinase domain-containing protein n=1 Tax=Salvia splendens TaxID=180675 RepID=A0A8X8YF41_SALSN|nr:hypothetical protein SASPL_112760 [Salvia splendens]
MGSCLSVEGEKYQQREKNSSCGNHGIYVESKSPVKSNSNTFVIIPKNVKDLLLSPGNGDLDIFTYEEMRLATKGFRPDQVLGKGGFGIVYRGVIDENVRPGYKTTQIAVKVLDPESLQGDREWLVSFCGVRTTLTWHRRLKIALDTARGLAFLHGVEKPIIYRDFKTSNILLDEVWHLTARSDVYGFGVVLLEMLLGRRTMEKSRPSREHNLVEWARPLLNHSKKLLRILDRRIEGQYSAKILMKVANLAYQCLSQNPKGRPLMSQVIEILQPLVTQESIPIESSGGITLYEVPKGAPQNPNEGLSN